MRALWVLALTVSIANAADWNLPAPFVGCYELRVLSQQPALLKKSDFLPRRFVLTARSTNPQARLSDQRFVVQNTDTNVRWGLSGFSSWRPKNPDEFEIIWSTGFVAYRVSLRKAEGEFRGKAQYSTDADPHPIEPFSVGVRQTGCKTN